VATFGTKLLHVKRRAAAVKHTRTPARA